MPYAFKPSCRATFPCVALAALLCTSSGFAGETDAAKAPSRTLGEEGRLGLSLEKTGSDFTITNVVPGSPAAKAGIRRGAIIRKINRQSVATAALPDALKLLRGPVGSAVEVEVVGPGQAPARQVRLTREILPDVEDRILEGHVGLLSLYNFGTNTPAKVTSALEKWRQDHVSGIVLDLRGNGGGSLQAITDIAGFFVGAEKVVTIAHFSDGRPPEKSLSTRSELWHGPVVVIVDGQTASGAEVLAAALRIQAGAGILGQPTMGSADIRTGTAGSFKTRVVGSLFTAADEQISGKGVKPDVVVDDGLPGSELFSKAVLLLQKTK